VATTFPVRLAGAVATLLAMTACSDGTGPGEKPVPHPEFPVPATALAALTCNADLQAHAVTCEPLSTPASGSFVLGGQGKNLTLTGTNLAVANGVATFDVTVQNLMVFRMGTDGVTTSGIKVFFYSGPTSGGAGSVDVQNPDGTDAVLNGDQPYYTYPQVLAYNQVSAPRQWRFTLNGNVPSFSFKVYVQTELLPVLVFDRLVAGNRDLYRVALDGSDLTRLTTNPGEDMDATVGGGTVVFTSYRDGNAELYSVPLLGGAETRLTTTPAVTESDAALSNDGTRLAYSADPSGAAKIWLANANGTGAVRATPGFGLDASPDAGPAWFPGSTTRLAFVTTSNGTADIYDVTVGSTPTLLKGGNSAEITPAWNLDGTKMSYSSNTTGDTELYLLDVATKVSTRLTTRTLTDGAGSWTPDGRIVYLAYTGTGTDNQLRWINPTTLAAANIPLTGTGTVLRPVAVPRF
jgi:hypothetical protein